MARARKKPLTQGKTVNENQKQGIDTNKLKLMSFKGTSECVSALIVTHNAYNKAQNTVVAAEQGNTKLN